MIPDDLHLTEAWRHVVEGEQRIARQEALILRLSQNGRDTAEAKRLLALMHESLALMKKHVQRLREGSR